MQPAIIITAELAAADRAMLPGFGLLRCHLSRLFSPGLIAGSDRNFRRVNLGCRECDLTWRQAPFLPMQQIQDRLQLGLGLVNLGDFGLDLGLCLRGWGNA